jgi:hypothetical protein
MSSSLQLSLLVAMVGPAACTSDGVDTTPDATTGGSTALQEGYMKATWAAGVTVTFGDCTIRYQSNGLPNHARDAEYAVPNAGAMVPTSSTAHAATDPSTEQNYDVTLSTCPTLQTTSKATSLGNIGYIISGASLFNPYEGDGVTVALANNFSVTNANGDPVYFVDACNAHPTPSGQFHYHGLPPCVTAQVDQSGGPSHLIGVALDGFPIYGDRDATGAQITEAQLDECNGITSPTPEFPDGVYHYVLLDTPSAASSLRCLRGAFVTPPGGGMPQGGGGPMARTVTPAGGCAPNVPLATLEKQAARA